MKKYGIRVTLPPGDTMLAPHLLGDKFEMFRWYDSEAARDAAFVDMQRQIPYYRASDVVTQVLEKTERDVG